MFRSQFKTEKDLSYLWTADNIWKMLQITRLEHLFKITADIHTAEKMLEAIQKKGQLFLVEFARCFCSVKVKLTIQAFRFVDLFSNETTLFRQEGITDAL